MNPERLNCTPLLTIIKYIRQSCIWFCFVPCWYFPARTLSPLPRLAAQLVHRTSHHHYPGNSRCLSQCWMPFPLSWVIMSCWWSTSSRSFLRKKWKGNLLRLCMPSNIISTLKLDWYSRYVENCRLGIFSSKVFKGIVIFFLLEG